MVRNGGEVSGLHVTMYDALIHNDLFFDICGLTTEQVVSGTPGRVFDMIRRRNLRTRNLKVCVCVFF